MPIHRPGPTVSRHNTNDKETAMTDLFAYADDLGPLKIIHVHEPTVGLRAVLVVDNVARGPSIGGVRMAPDVTTEECVRLARAMTLKNAAAGLPHGGGKAVLFGDPKMPKDKKERLIRALAQALRNEEDYIFAPDMGTDEECMAWVRDEIARVVALPRDLGGIPLDEIGATGFGLTQAAEVAAKHIGITLTGARVVVQGFGAVGKHAALFLAAKGATLVAAADSQGAIVNAAGLDVSTLVSLKQSGKSVAEYSGGRRIPADAVVDVECDIWIPAARPDVIRDENADRLKARIFLEGANIPATHDAERSLHDRGVLCIPDFIANAGGVICAAMEYRGATQAAALQTIEEKVRRNTEQMLAQARRDGITPREAAERLAVDRVRRAVGYRRHGIFSSAPGWV
jgi:glutamate dehydrogenase (NAD(P)+)